MKKEKIVSVLLIILMLIISLTTKSFAADSFSASLTPDSSRVSKGRRSNINI